MERKHDQGANLGASKWIWMQVKSSETSQSSRKESEADRMGHTASGRLVQLVTLGDHTDLKNRLERGRPRTCCCIKAPDPGYAGVVHSLQELNAAVVSARAAEGTLPPHHSTSQVSDSAQTLITTINECLPRDTSRGNRDILTALRTRAENLKKDAEQQAFQTPPSTPFAVEPEPPSSPPVRSRSRSPQTTDRRYADLNSGAPLRVVNVTTNAATRDYTVNVLVSNVERTMLFKPAALESKQAQRRAAAWRVARELRFGVVPYATSREMPLDGKRVFGALEERVNGRPLSREGRLVLRSTQILSDAQMIRLLRYATERGFTKTRMPDGGRIELQRIDPETRTYQRERPGGRLKGTPKALPVMRTMDWSCPALRRQLTQLQWLDTVIGEDGRDRGNILFEQDEDGTFKALWGVNTANCFRADVDNALPWPDQPASLPGEVERKHAPDSDDEPAPPAALPRATDSWRPAPPRVLDRADLGALRDYLKRAPDEICPLLEGLGAPDQKAHHALRADLFGRVERLAREEGAILTTDADWSSEVTDRRLGLTAVYEAMSRIDALRPPPGRESSEDRELRQGKIREEFKAMHARARATSYVAREAAVQMEHGWYQEHWRDHPDRVPVFGPKELSQAIQPFTSYSSSSQTTRGTNRRTYASSSD